jgi:branched-chain amino acid transport system substrate-binding protein
MSPGSKKIKYPQRRSNLPRFLFFLTFIFMPLNASGTGDLRLYIDADQTGAKQSSQAIERGIRTALSEVDNKLGGRNVSIVIKDHRGNSRRSKANMQAYLDDTAGLAIFAGLHSPPLLENREFINNSGILVLDPWAAAGPITRYPSRENWIFRLSVDDTKAGHIIVNHAYERGFTRPALLLENTGWGRSNETTMKKAAGEITDAFSISEVFWFNWGLQEEAARITLRNIAGSGADCILLVANAPEGKMIAQAMVTLEEELRLPICSHWGITGGDFAEVINLETRAKLDLTFLQTRFSFVNGPDTPLSRRVFEQAQALFPDIQAVEDIEAPTGFIHAYDLTKLLIAAMDRIALTCDIAVDRNALRAALELIETPVQGLIKEYRQPFRQFDVTDDPDAHEALSIDDLCMARYGAKNEIILIQAP